MINKKYYADKLFCKTNQGKQYIPRLHFTINIIIIYLATFYTVFTPWLFKSNTAHVII